MSDGSRRRVVPILVAIAVTLSSVAAHQAQQAPQTTFRGGVDYVAVDVVVTGTGEKPISDLTAADFEIRENGKPQRITDFRYVNIPVEHRKVDLTATPAPEPDVVTNAPSSPDSRLFVMVVDDLHILESMIVPVQRVMTEFISTLSPSDEVAIVYVQHSNLSQNFTRETGQLLTTVRNVRTALGFGLATPAGEGQDGSLAPRIANEELADGRSTAWVLQNVASALARSNHARRAIVLVSAFSALNPAAPVGSTESMDADTLHERLNEAFDAARRANVPIYTLDPRGLAVPETAVRGWISSGREIVARRIRIQQDHLAEIATATGGRAFVNRSDLAGSVDEIVAENGSFYMLGYYPDPYARDGKFHDISVKVTRPGAHVRARQGYVAADANAPPVSLRATMDAAMGAGLNVSGLNLRAFAAPMAAAARGMTTAVTVEVAYPVPADGSRHVDDDLQLTVMALDPDGKVKASWSRPWHFGGATPAAGTVSFLMDDAIDLPAQALTLRVGVASKALGTAGTIQLPIDVPKLSDNKLQLSGVAIGYAGGTREAAMGTDALKALLPFQPTTARTFAATDTLRVFARAFWGTKDTDAGATLTVTGVGAAAVGSPRTVPLVSSAAAKGHRQATVDATLALNGLVGGDYVLHVDVRLPGGQTARRDVVFAVR